MIHFDVTKMGAAGHRSGLMRVSERLRDELGASATPVRWPWPADLGGETDWLLTAEIFSPEERPGFTEWLAQRRCRTAAIFYDAIPLRFPTITWPQSVVRHPGYMKMLAGFDRVWAISEASRQELLEFWRWQDAPHMPVVEVLPLGADFNRSPRVTTRQSLGRARLLCIGIVEPRKNQSFLLDVAEQLWRAGVDFDLDIVGRVNPHFGRPIVQRLKKLQRSFPGLRFHEAASDALVAELYASARTTVFPTIAEGCGLPLLESLWMGVPCVASDLPVLRENADGGGCALLPVNDVAAWQAGLGRILTDNIEHARLTEQAVTRPLPTWAAAAGPLRAALAPGSAPRRGVR